MKNIVPPDFIMKPCPMGQRRRYAAPQGNPQPVGTRHYGAMIATAERIRSLVHRFGLPSELPNHPRSAYLDALRVDKKMADSKIRFVVLRGMGRADTVPLTPREVLPAAGRR